MTNFFPAELVAQARALLRICQEVGLKIALAESCTGGLVCAILTEVPGASKVVERSFVTYSNTAKIEILGVSASLLKIHGSVSKAVAYAMATGVLSCCPSVALTVGVTGIAGPGGGSLERPVGLVHMAAIRRGVGMSYRQALFHGDRTAVRLAAASAALELLQRLAEQH